MTDSYTSLVDSLTIDDKPGYAQKRMAQVVPVNTYAARRKSDGMEALVLQLNSSSLSRIPEWPDSKGFSVKIIPGKTSPEKDTGLCLQLTEKRYREVFHALCEDVCRSINKASTEQEAVQAFQKRLFRWQHFLKKNRPDGLSPEAQTGLFGELLVLRDLFLEWLDPVETIRAWRGCKKAHQDFQFPGKAMEIKTTRADVPDRITIANVQQLDEDGVAPLILTVVHVHANETSGQTLPEMVKSIRAKLLTGNAREYFEEGLIEVKYFNLHENLYENSRYEPKQMLHHEVKTGFPRILHSSLPDGVKKVRYDISIDAAQPFRIEEDRVREIFQAGNNGDGG